MKEPLAILHTESEAPGAWPNGTVVVKANSQPDDANPDGTQGVVTGSLDVRDVGRAATFVYFVKWAGFPVPVLCADTNNDGTPRLEPVVDVYPGWKGIVQPCDLCRRPVAVNAVSPSECFCSVECAQKAAGL